MKHTFFDWLLLITLMIAIQAGIACAADGTTPATAGLNTLSVADAEEAVGAALAQKGAAAHVQAIIIGQRQKLLYSGEKPMHVEVKGLQFDKVSYRWSGNLLFVADGEVVSAMPVAGRYQEMVSFPVLKRAVRAGETIAEEDVEYADFAQPRIKTELIEDAGAMIGKSPRRMIPAHRPLRVSDLSAPQVLKKNAMVQLSYKTSSMEITTAGQAMDAGAPGDVINVKNLASKAVVRGVVQDDRTVTVAPFVQSTALMGDTHVN